MKGISLDDEGVAGERADWDAKLVIGTFAGDVPSWRAVGVTSAVTAAVPGGTLVFVDDGEYDEGAGDDRRRRYRPAEARVYFGLKPVGTKAGESGYTVDVEKTDQARGLVVTLRGNAALVKDVLTKADWTRVVVAAQK
jgi:hypothetical protein